MPLPSNCSTVQMLALNSTHFTQAGCAYVLVATVFSHTGFPTEGRLHSHPGAHAWHGERFLEDGLGAAGGSSCYADQGRRERKGTVAVVSMSPMQDTIVFD